MRPAQNSKNIPFIVVGISIYMDREEKQSLGLELEMETKKVHVLVFPFPGHGHMIPLLDLAHILATRGLAVTVFTTTENQALLRPLLTTASSQGLHIQSLILPLPPTQGLPPHCENLAQLPLHLVPLFMYSFKHFADPLEQWILHQRSSDGFGPPLCIISDFFLGWTQDLAAKLGIRRVVFYPSGAFAVSVVSSLWKHMPHHGVESDDGEVCIPELPHPVTFPKSKISPLARMYKPSDPISEFIRHGFNLNVKSWGSIINTFDGLEALYIDHLQKLSGSPVWSVGPLLPPVVFQGTPNLERGNPNAIKESACLQWLDSRQRRSVLYICFGSIAVLSNRQIEDVAAGLEASEESFIWVIKDHPYSRISDDNVAHEYGGVLPPGFEERTKERGLVIRGWAPQLLILSHSSVGGFVTHCGWNSCLESIALGVPLIAWPMGADQYSDALLLVDYLKVGVRLCEGPAAMPSRDDLKRAVKKVTAAEAEESKRAEELSSAARMAVEAGGSSWKNLEALVTEIKKLTPIH
ncbi:hypothetical protein KI387_002430 [Taxus chinensis]|uniref:Glycosyltransferase n=1 Tax=Taxus chinensis TaxID=29808 RepID=A0AA38LR43_TAXCH|nr:hypothetical protein KI387_002430 [Taxus chinensis]